jgi:alkylated DNA repair dioxygenase AlkB
LRDATGAEDIVSEIAAAAASDDSEPDSAALQAWADETRSILRADTTIHLGDWKSAPVGKAIQLVLARPEPARFKGWLDDQPALSPAVWWSAATLCGLIHGYRRLDMQFRGDAAQRRLLAVHAASASVAPEPMWSDAPTAAPRWRRDSGRFVLSWAGTDFASKLEHPRGRWYGADMGAPDVRRAAREMSRRLGWPCLHRELVVADDTLALAGPGEIEVTSEPSRSVAVRGKVRVRLPSQTVLEDIVDADEFRRCLVTEGGAHIPEPPTPRGPVLGHPEVPGLLYTPEFLSPSEEAELVARLDRAEWLPDLQRRVQHYGWRYNYKARQVDASMRLGPLPPWAKQLAQRLAARGLLPHLADQVIVNEYCGKQGISKHVDCAPCFADGVAMISLLESWEMVFKEQRGGRKVPHRLERRSVAVMTGDARYRWTHEIPKRLTEPGGVRRQRRISVTFRKVNETAARSYGR